MRVLVTPYEDPDMDGVACAYAYAELLRSQGHDAVAAIFGRPDQEAEYVLAHFNVPSLEDAAYYLDRDIILVDASDTTGIPKVVDPAQVVEIIDHRQVHEAHLFVNAKLQIELVGAAATLVAEKFTGEISRESAALLYCAIVSNTINFMASVTTDRDRVAASAMKAKAGIPDSFVYDMFQHKSRIENLHAAFEQHKALFGTFEIIQLELVDTDEFIKRSDELKSSLVRVREEDGIAIIFLTIIDIEKGYNLFVTIDSETETILERLLNVKFENGIARREGIIMRKEIVPMIRAYMK